MHSFCTVHTGLVSKNYDSAGGVREITLTAVPHLDTVFREYSIGCNGV